VVTPKCKRCGTGELIHLGGEMKKRALTFFCLALLLGAGGALLQSLAIAAWPILLYGVAGFVLLQALIKLRDHASCYCKPCDLRQYHWLR